MNKKTNYLLTTTSKWDAICLDDWFYSGIQSSIDTNIFKNINKSISDIYKQYYQVTPATESWIQLQGRQFAIVVSQDADNIDDFNKQIRIQTNNQVTRNISDFSENVQLIRTFINNSNQIQLEFGPIVIGLIIDKSGSISISDPNNNGIDVAKRLINRLSSTYSGDIKYIVSYFGGKQYNINIVPFISTQNRLDSDFNSLNVFTKSIFYNDIYNVYGIRVVRSLSPIISINDGHIIYDGLYSNFKNDILLESNTRYYYNIYTYNKLNQFSLPYSFYTYTNNNIDGINNIQYMISNGTGQNRNFQNELYKTISLWHFNEKDTNQILDFGGTSILKSEDILQWSANSNNLPIGNNSVLVSKDTSIVSQIETQKQYSGANGFSISMWVYPFGLNSFGTLFSRFLDQTIDYQFGINSSGFLYFYQNGGATETSSNAIVYEQWNFVSVSFNLTNIEFFINGVISGSFPYSFIQNISNQFICLGKATTSQNANIGYISQVSYSSGIKIQSDFLLQYNLKSKSGSDNGDRQILFKFYIQPDSQIVGKNIKFIRNDQFVPNNIFDGYNQYFDKTHVIRPGMNYVLYDSYKYGDKYDLVNGYNTNFKTFVYDNANNSSNGYYSQQISFSVKNSIIGDNYPQIIQFPQISLNSISGDRKNYIYSNQQYSDNFNQVIIAYGQDDYPNVGDVILSQNIIFRSNLIKSDNKIRFVHYLLENKQYFYSVFFIDRFGRVSKKQNLKCVAGLNTSDLGIPVKPIQKVNFVQRDNSIYISWQSPVENNNLNGFFDDEINFYLQINDQVGTTLKQDYQTQYSVNVTGIVNSRSGQNVFAGQTLAVQTDLSTCYQIKIDNIRDGISHGNLKILSSLLTPQQILKYDYINFSIDIQLVKNIQNKKITIKTKSINIKLYNPIQVQILNRDNLYAKYRCYDSISSKKDSQGQFYNTFNGLFIGTSNKYCDRLLIKYRGEFVNSVFVNAIIYNSTGSFCVGESSFLLSDIRSQDVQNSELIIDSDTDGLISKSYIDYFIDPSTKQQMQIVYYQISYNGLTIVRKSGIASIDTLVISLNASVPNSDGLTISQQVINAYLLDPNFPDDSSKISNIPDGIQISWQLSPANPVDNPQRSIYSTYSGSSSGITSVVSNGSSRGVFIGPISNVSPPQIGSTGDFIFQQQILTVSMIFNGNKKSVSQSLVIMPLQSIGVVSQQSYFLSQFDNIKNKLFSDGTSYAKMVISTDANSSTTKYSDDFRDFMLSLGKTIYPIQPGQLIFISSSEKNVQIISGDVIQSIDQVNGQNILITTNAKIDKGSSYIESSDGSQTLVYFRYSNTSLSQKTIGQETQKVYNQILQKEIDFKYKNEITISSNMVTFDNGFTRSISSGGSVSLGIIPTILVPYNPLSIVAVARKSNNEIVQNFEFSNDIDNQIVFQISYSGYPVTNNTEILFQSNDEYSFGLKLQEYSDLSESKIDVDIDPIYIRSYASAFIERISNIQAFSTNIKASVSYKGFDAEICVPVYNGTQYQKSTIQDESFKLTLSGWQQISSMNHKRSGFKNIVAQNRIFAIGGFNSSGLLSSIQQYIYSSDIWQERSDMPSKKSFYQAISYNQYIYVFGGIQIDILTGYIVQSKSVLRYDITIDQWIQMSQMPIGVSFGNAQIIGTNVFILCGAKNISDDGLSFSQNNYVLKYDITMNSWQALSSSFQKYQRIGSSSFISGDKIYISGGIKNFNGEVSTQLQIFSYDTVSQIFQSQNSSQSDVFNSRSRSGYCQDGNQIYISGGLINNQVISNTSSHMQISGVLSKIDQSNLARNLIDCAMAVYNDGSSVVMMSGGSTYGVKQNLVNIQIISNNTMNVDFGSNVNCSIYLRDLNNKLLSDSVQILVNAYLQDSSIENIGTLVDTRWKQNKIILSENYITVINGIHNFNINGILDDYLNVFNSDIVFGQKNTTFNILITAKIIDPNYIGGRQALFVPQVQSQSQFNCLNQQIVGVGKADLNDIKPGSFSLFNSRAKSSGYINISSIKQKTIFSSSIDFGIMQKQQAIQSLNQIQTIRNIGMSDASQPIMNFSQIASQDIFDSYKKNIIIIGDGNLDFVNRSKNDVINSIISISGTQQSKLYYSNIHTNTKYFEPSINYQSIRQQANQVAVKTSGKIISLVDILKIDNFMYQISSIVAASGYFSYVYRIMDESLLTYIVLNGDLCANTDAQYFAYISNDGYNFAFIGKNKLNNPIYIDNKKCSYIKISGKLVSGLGISNDQSMQILPNCGTPYINQLVIKFIPQKNDYIYIKNENTTLYPGQSSIVCRTEQESNIQIKTNASSQNLYSWNNYQSVSNVPNINGGFSYVPIRGISVGNGIQHLQDLVKIDKYLFRAKNGAWGQTCRLYIKDSDGNVVSSNSYTSVPSKGLVSFNTKMNGQYKIAIFNSNNINIGIKLSNFSATRITIKDIGYKYIGRDSNNNGFEYILPLIFVI